MAAQQTRKGSTQFDSVRATALQVLERVQKGTQIDDAMNGAMQGQNLRPIDIRFIRQLVNGTTKTQRRLDCEMRSYLSKPLSQLPARVHLILRLGFYQLLFLDRVPDAAAVNEAVNLAHRFCGDALARLVNAVMRARLREPEKVRFASPENDPVTYLGEYFSYPDYFVEYCLDEFRFEATTRLLEQYNRPPHVTYRVNFIKAKPDEVAHLLHDEGIEFSYGRFLPEFIHIEQGGMPMENELLNLGKVFVQDESSGLPVRLLNPKPASEVVDLTAAPGGKATYCAIRMRNRGRVTAVDKSRDRLQLVVENAARLGIKIISPVHSDALDFEGGPFDRVLLDPPCSGWGTARKNADLRWAKTIEDINSLAKLQKQMIHKASTLVKPGGVLVYSTCTIIRKENDQVVEEFLLRHKDFELEDASAYFDKPLVNDRGFVKTYPNFEDLDGSFCARLRRKLNP